jgi:uncharacterized membrane protein
MNLVFAISSLMSALPTLHIEMYRKQKRKKIKTRSNGQKPKKNQNMVI